MFFVMILVESYLIDDISSGTNGSTEDKGDSFYELGWVGFAVIFLYNIGFIVLMVIDVVVGCKYSNRELMEESRRVYYYDKI